jgi:sugar transferase (PEP-CTERM system associated)
MLPLLIRYLAFHKMGAVILEHGLIIVCVLVDGLQAPMQSPPPVYYTAWAVRAFAISITFQVCLHFRDVYDFRAKASTPEFLIRVVQAVLLASAVIGTSHYLFPALPVSTDTLIAILLRTGVFLTLWHILLRVYFGMRAKRLNVLILGTGRLARALAAEIVRYPQLGLSVSGFVDDDPALVGVSIVNPKVIGLTKDLQRIVADKKIDRVIVAVHDRRGRLPTDELIRLKIGGVGVEEATSLYERVTGKIPVENLKPSWMIFNEGFTVSRWTLLQKQIISVAVSSLLLALWLPFLPLIALLIKLDSRGPVFHRQDRVGQDGKVFTLWKFRSMRQDAEKTSGPVWSSTQDDRVTRVGTYLRRTRVDELPQLYNVLKGDMSLVGPRPERPHFVDQLSAVIPFYHLRHSVKPGVTGWAQINYRYGQSVEDSMEKLQYDLFYIKNMSWLLDSVILFDTAKTVLLRAGS